MAPATDSTRHPTLTPASQAWLWSATATTKGCTAKPLLVRKDDDREDALKRPCTAPPDAKALLLVLLLLLVGPSLLSRVKPIAALALKGTSTWS